MNSAEKAIKFVFLVAALSLLLGGCKRGEQTVTLPLQPQKARVLRLLSWSDYFDPEMLTAFEQSTGIRVEYVTFSELDELEAKLRSQPGSYDVIVSDDSSSRELWDLRLLRELDREKIPNLKNIDEQFLGLPFDRDNAFSAPYLWGTTLVAYRADHIEDPETSWDLLWDGALKGKVMVMVDRLETLSVTLMALGYQLNSENEKEINHAADRAIEQLELIDVRYGDDADVRAGLDDGTIWAAMCYSGDAAMVAAENENVAFFIPREGAPLWIDSFTIARDSNYPEEAHQLIDYMLGGEVAAANSNFTYYASPNKAAVPFIDPELLADETINPPKEVLERCTFFQKPTPQRDELANRAWLRIQKVVQRRAAAKESGKEAGSTAQTSP